MKKFIIVIISITFFNCTSKIKSIDSSEFNNARYWISTYADGTTEEELKEYANLYSIRDQTTFHFFYPDTLDVSKHNRVPVYFDRYAKEILKDPKPTFGLYKMANDTKIYEDALWLLEVGEN
jgi:hypothetical protein